MRNAKRQAAGFQKAPPPLPPFAFDSDFSSSHDLVVLPPFGVDTSDFILDVVDVFPLSLAAHVDANVDGDLRIMALASK
ncbi:hypothetical protein ACLOJK_013752 [Asimina triloba]